ncbi:WxL protein peptidoglycan domain-containing protein [Paenibacillus sp. GCM10027627]|uniref:WxL protein peptidoglycan domain-containing protein n=1 Tax=unclassified Paenibacillus TaxID=185978 RepID=UPI0036370629
MLKKMIGVLLVIFLLVPHKAMAEINIIAVESDQDYYDVTAVAGETRTFEFKLVNNGTKAAEAVVYPSQQLTAINGGQAFISSDDSVSGIGKWISNSKETIKLSPNEAKTVTYQVKIPEQTTDGQYIVAIVSHNKNVSSLSVNSENNASVNISGPVDLVIAKQMVLNIGNQSTRYITIDSFSYTYNSDGSPVIGAMLTNHGTILEKPKTTIHIKSDKNEIIESVVLDNHLSFYQGTEQVVRLTSEKLLNHGNYKAQVIVEYSGMSVERTFDFTVTKTNVEKSLQALKETGGDISTVSSDEKTTFMYYVAGSLTIIIFLLLLLLFILLRKKTNRDTSPRKEIGG